MSCLFTAGHKDRIISVGSDRPLLLTPPLSGGGVILFYFLDMVKYKKC